MIEHHLDGFKVAKNRDTLERQGVRFLIDKLRRPQFQAFLAVRGDGNREPHVGSGFGIGASLPA